MKLFFLVGRRLRFGIISRKGNGSKSLRIHLNRVSCGASRGVVGDLSPKILLNPFNRPKQTF